MSAERPVVQQGLAPRLVSVVVLCSLLTVPLVALSSGTAVVTLLLERLNPVHQELDRLDAEACAQDPERFTRVRGQAFIFAYDITTGESSNPAAPATPPAVHSALQEPDSPERIIRVYGLRSEFRGGLIASRVSAAGPCSMLVVRWTADPTDRAGVLAQTLGPAFVGVILAIALALFAGIYPLLRRLRRLGRAAGSVGSESPYEEIGDNSTDVIGALARTLDEADRRIRKDTQLLEDRHRALEEHLDNVAHDLRTPLASLNLSLEGTAAALDDPVLKERVQFALREVVYLSSLTDNLRMATRLQDGSGPLDGGVISDLGSVVDRVSARFEALGRQQQISVAGARPDGPVEMVCTPIMAEQVVANLVANSVKYGDPGGHVAVLLELVGDRFRLTVADDGPGVPPSLIPRLGERTFRTDEARSRDHEGGGLGLSIVGEICARAGWQLEFKAQEPRGLVAVIEGPLAA